MASIKNLKKDVAFFADDIVATLCFKNAVVEGKDEKTSELVIKAMAYKQEFLKKINNCTAAKNDKKAVKAYYRNLCKEVFDEFKKLIDEVNAY